MNDYQRVVEFIRDFRPLPGQAVSDELRRYAADYAQLCTQSNERLRQCSALLQQGLRSEAIHLANEAPPLLEAVAALDLPEAGAWGEFCQHTDLPVAPPLQMDRAAQLNEAYGQEEPLEGLLRRHRRLALAHAQVKDRLETMRQIREIDAASPFWEKDIRELEAIRMRELRVAFAAALENHDAQAVTALSAEVLQSPWIEPVSKDLLAAANGAEERLRLLAVDHALRSLLNRLRSAYTSRDHAACTSLVHEIRKLLADAKQGVSEQTATELNPIIAWIAQEDAIAHRRHAAEKAQRQLREAMDGGAPEATLEARMRAVRDLGEEVPPEIEQRRQQRIQEQFAQTRRRTRLAIAGVAAALLAVLIGSYFYFRSDVASGWARRIREANEARDLERARQLVEEQQRRAPEFSGYAAIVDARQQTARLAEEFERDQRLYQPLLQSLTQQQQRSAAEIASAEKLTVQQLLTAAREDAYMATQAQAGKHLAWVDKGGAFATTLAALESQARQHRELADQKALAQAKSMTEQLDRLGIAADSASRAAAELQALAGELLPLRKTNGLGKDAADAVAALSSKYDEKLALLAKHQDQSQQRQALRGKAVSSELWQKSLEDYAARFPEAPETAQFRRAIDLLKGAAAIEALQALESAWSGEYAPASEAAARKRLQELRDYLAAQPQSPFAPAVKSYIAYLGQAADAMAVKSSWMEAFRDLLSNPMMSELRYVMASDSTRYYILGNFKPKISRTNDRLSVSFDAIDPSDLTKRRTVTISPPLSLLSDKPAPTAQTRFMEALAVQLKQINAANWDSFGIRLVEQLQQEKEMDIVVRAMLIEQTLKAATQITGWGMGGIYDQAIADLARQELDNIVWYDPEKPVPAAVVTALQQIVDALPKADAALKSLAENRQKLFGAASCSFAATGSLMRDDNGNWAVYPCGAGATEGSAAWAAGAAPKPDQPAPLLRVARYEKDRFVVDNSLIGRSNLPDGTMVFIGK
jgi:hypothetical protein